MTCIGEGLPDPVGSRSALSAMAKQAHKTPSQRQRRVAEEIRHTLALALDRGEIRDLAVTAQPVTVTSVRMSPDLRVARVAVTPLGGGDPAPLLQGLGRAAPALRQFIGKSIRLRATPELRFVHDDSFDALERIETLLRDPKVARDLTRPARPAGDDPQDGQETPHGPS